MDRDTSWLFIHSSDELYGADRILLMILDALPQQTRARARVWLPSDLPHGEFPLCVRIRQLGIRVDHVPLPILRRANLTPQGLAPMVGNVARLRSAVKKMQPDVVYGTTSATLAALVAATGSGRRIILHNQEVWAPREGMLLGALARSANQIIAISDATKDSMPANAQRHTTVVLNATADPVPQDGFKPLSDVPPEPIQFLAAGRWIRRKGFDVLLDAWANSAPGHLTIVGGPPPSGEALDLTAMVAALPDPGSVTLLDEVDSINDLISESHVVVMPSVSEPFGLVAIEAMAAGRPVIASAVGGLARVVTPDVGWSVVPADVEALRSALNAVTPAEITIRGKNARARYLREYSIDRYCDNWRTAVGLN